MAATSLLLPRRLDGLGPRERFSASAMDRQVRILFLVSDARVSPSVAVHADLMRHLNPERVEVHAVHPHAGREGLELSSAAALAQIPQVASRPVSFGPRLGSPRAKLGQDTARAFRDAGALIGFIRRRRIDIIHCEEGIRDAFYAYLLSRVTPARCLVHFHLGYGDWMSRPSREAIHRADAVIAVSEWTGGTIRDDGVPAQRIFPVLNGIEVGGWDPEGVDPIRIRREFGLDLDDPLIVQVAQLIGWKRQHLVIEAMPRVLERHPSARIMFVGAETPGLYEGPGTYLESLKRRVAAAGLQDRVIFTGRRQDVRQILAAADVFTLPSVGEPFGLAFVEAMAMGNPVVSVRSGGIPEVVEDGTTGLLGEPDDAGQLAANITALLDDPGRRRVMGDAGRRAVLTRFTAQRMADDVEAVYRSVIGLR